MLAQRTGVVVRLSGSLMAYPLWWRYFTLIIVLVLSTFFFTFLPLLTNSSKNTEQYIQYSGKDKCNIVLSKMFQKLMCARLDSYLKSNNILCTNQFGFCKNSNTSHAIIEFLYYVYSSLDKKQSTIALYLDFSKAFDTVNHEILMSKLQHNGIRGVMQSWFKSYLSNRKQYVSVKNISSSMSNISLGVPQGSVLGPVLFFVHQRHA